MTIQEALSQGGQTAVVGLSTVFAVLIILMIVLYIMKAVFYKEPERVKEEAVKAEPQAAEEPENEMDETELIAVITAAVAASLNTSTYNLQIKSYRRLENTKPAWNRAGVSETINNRF